MKTTVVKCQKRVPIRTHPMTDPDEDELLGPPTNISVPGGHSDDYCSHHFPRRRRLVNNEYYL